MTKEASEGPGGPDGAWSILNLFETEGLPPPEHDDDYLTIRQKIALISAFRKELERSYPHSLIRDQLQEEIKRLEAEVELFKKTQSLGEQNHGIIEH